jgi:hypothetical protein
MIRLSAERTQPLAWKGACKDGPLCTLPIYINTHIVVGPCPLRMYTPWDSSLQIQAAVAHAQIWLLCSLHSAEEGQRHAALLQHARMAPLHVSGLCIAPRGMLQPFSTHMRHRCGSQVRG